MKNFNTEKYIYFLFRLSFIYSVLMVFLVVVGVFYGLGLRVILFVIFTSLYIYLIYKYFLYQGFEGGVFPLMIVFGYIFILISDVFNSNFLRFVKKTKVDIEYVFNNYKEEKIVFKEFSSKRVHRSVYYGATGYFKKNNSQFIGLCSLSSFYDKPCFYDYKGDYVLHYYEDYNVAKGTFILRVLDSNGVEVVNNYENFKKQQLKNVLFIF